MHDSRRAFKVQATSFTFSGAKRRYHPCPFACQAFLPRDESSRCFSCVRARWRNLNSHTFSQLAVLATYLARRHKSSLTSLLSLCLFDPLLSPSYVYFIDVVVIHQVLNRKSIIAGCAGSCCIKPLSWPLTRTYLYPAVATACTSSRDWWNRCWIIVRSWELYHHFSAAASQRAAAGTCVRRFWEIVLRCLKAANSGSDSPVDFSLIVISDLFTPPNYSFVYTHAERWLRLVKSN